MKSDYEIEPNAFDRINASEYDIIDIITVINQEEKTE